MWTKLRYREIWTKLRYGRNMDQT